LNIDFSFIAFLVANKWIHERGQEFRYPCEKRKAKS